MRNCSDVNKNRRINLSIDAISVLFVYRRDIWNELWIAFVVVLSACTHFDQNVRLDKHRNDHKNGSVCNRKCIIWWKNYAMNIFNRFLNFSFQVKIYFRLRFRFSCCFLCFRLTTSKSTFSALIPFYENIEENVCSFGIDENMQMNVVCSMMTLIKNSLTFFLEASENDENDALASLKRTNERKLLFFLWNLHKFTFKRRWIAHRTHAMGPSLSSSLSKKKSENRK